MKNIKRSDLSFDEVVRAIVLFLKPVWNGIVDEEEFFGEWNKNRSLWNLATIPTTNS